MEAATPKRAAIRLALLGAGAVSTVAMVVATVYLANRSEEPVAERPDWDPIETGESYQLPVAEESAAPTPTALAPAATAYEPPAYSEPVAAPVPPTFPAAPFPTTGTPDAAETAWSGPKTIHNPAAYGPPESDALPPVPGEGPALSVASRPVPTDPVGVATAPLLEAPAPSVEFSTEAPRRPNPAPGKRISERVLAAVQAEKEEAPELPEVEAAPASIGRMGYTLSTNNLSQRLEKDVRAAFQLGKSGAVYAARSRFVGVLRRIALAKDAEAGGTAHSEALAEGLRTLDDADDFVPRGDALEAELEVASIAESHGLKLVGEGVAPHEAVARYSHHAAERLAVAAAGEPAGSMALYGLGKTYARLESQGEAEAGRKSAVMFRAAMQTHPENYLAANELGVRLARDGHYEQAGEVLRLAASRPDAIAMVHANLAAIEQQLGQTEQAAVAQQQSVRLAQRERVAGEVSRRHGVEWVSPEDFRRGSSGPVTPSVAVQPAIQQPAIPQPILQQPVPPPTAQVAPVGYPAPPEQQGGFSGFMRTAKRAIGWGPATPAPQPYGVVPAGPPVVGPPQRALR